MYKISQFLQSMLICGVFSLLAGCSQPKILFEKSGGSLSDFYRDRYECTQQSRVSWSGGGSGDLGIAMIIISNSRANKQANQLFIMCMEARGYTWQEVSDNEFEQKKNRQQLTSNQITNHEYDHQDEKKLIMELTKIGNEHYNVCYREDLKSLLLKSACRIDSITLDQLADNSKITDNEKKLFFIYSLEHKAIYDKMNALLQNVSNPSRVKLLYYGLEDKVDKMNTELCERRISWGEYNKKRIDIFQSFNDEKRRILGEL